MQGHVHGFLGGSPCCTFSKPRSVALHQEHRCRAPRPVRTAAELWGLASLALRELDAVLEGSILLSCSAFALKPFLCWRSWADKVYLNTQLSRKPMMRLRFGNFQSFACCSTCQMYRRLSLPRVLHGASSRKPTTLLAANSPNLIQIMRKWQITADNPKGISIGKDCRGQFQTAHLKEYPPAVCTALAEVTWNATCTAPANDTAQLPVHFQEVCAKLNVTEYGDHVGPDFVHYGRPEVNSFVLRRDCQQSVCASRKI